MIKSGIIEAVSERPSQYKWPNGQPKASMWSMKVDNINYGLKNVKPPAQGSYVQFDCSQNEKGYWDADGSTIKIVPSPTPLASSAGQYPAPTSAKTGSVQFTDVRQDSIIYQSSRKDAIEFVTAMLDKDLIDFGKAKGAQKIELMEVYVDFYTSRFIEDVKRLAPPEHASPVDAMAPVEATALTKPAKKIKVLSDEDPFDDQIGF